MSKTEFSITAMREKNALAIADLTSEHGAEKSKLTNAAQDQIGALQTHIDVLKAQVEELTKEAAHHSDAHDEVKGCIFKAWRRNAKATSRPRARSHRQSRC